VLAIVRYSPASWADFAAASVTVKLTKSIPTARQEFARPHAFLPFNTSIMHLVTSLATLVLPLSYAISLQAVADLGPQHIISNPPDTSTTTNYPLHIPSIHDSAILARRILSLTTIGTLSTIFPSTSSSDNATTLENRPPHLGGMPIGLMDYIADCEQTGNPTLLALSIATSFKNVAAGSNISLSLNWIPPTPPSSSPFLNGPAAQPRFSLLGYLEDIEPDVIGAVELASCFTKDHPDARAWLPGNRIHESRWTRLVVEEIYWVGGFGDRAYIGWIPRESWANVTIEEVGSVRLPGEKEGEASRRWFW